MAEEVLDPRRLRQKRALKQNPQGKTEDDHHYSRYSDSQPCQRVRCIHLFPWQERTAETASHDKAAKEQGKVSLLALTRWY